MSKGRHWSDQDLLLYAGGELPAGSSQLRAHLEVDGCDLCRTRLRELENALAEFGESHRKAWEGEIPPAAESAALLKARLADLAASERGSGLSRSMWMARVGKLGTVAFAGVAIAACLLLALRIHGPLGRPRVMSASSGLWEEPDLRLTPGATVPVTENQLCGPAATRPVPAVPVSLKHRVFEEYGVTPPRPDAYEVDYLITPELGGATDIRNLWPQPYQNTVWNAHVKDQLEDRLHQMVCQGDVDLATAQRDIATDWIAAYRKYFHADRPLSDQSSSNIPPLLGSRPLS